MTVLTHSRGGYVRGCRCATCTTAHREYARAWRHNDYEPQTVDATAYRIIVQEVWRQTRMPLSELAAYAHLPAQTLRRLIDGRSERIWFSTAAAVRTLVALLPNGPPVDELAKARARSRVRAAIDEEKAR